MKKQLFTASFLLTALSSFGAGYQLNLQGLRQMAMGGTGAAWPWDASTIYYNPGGLSRLNNIQAYGSIAWSVPSTAFANQTNSGNISTDVNTLPVTYRPINFYIGGPVQQYSRFGIGLGIYTPYRSNVSWDNNWIGKYQVQSSNIRTVFFQPTVSYKISEGLSVGGGFIYASGTYDYSMALPVHGPLGPGIDDGKAELKGTSRGVGFNLGVNIKASENFMVGLTYRSQVNMDVDGGQATFKVPATLSKMYPNTNFDYRMPMPQVATVGLGWRMTDLTLQFDLSYTGWNSFDSTRIKFADRTEYLQNITTPRKYKNTFTPRFGASYKISKVLAVMAGAAYEPTPVAEGYVSPDMPDANRTILSCGLTIKPIRRLTIIAAFEGTSTPRRNANYDAGAFGGVYKTGVATPGIGVYYIF